MPHIVHNEQTKLFAGALDRIGTICIAVGVAPILSAVLVGVPNIQVTNAQALGSTAI